MTWIAGIAIITGCVTSIVYTCLAYLKAKEPKKDDVWETTTRMLCSSGRACDADDFIVLYEDLKLFKSLGCSLGDCHTIEQYRTKHRANR